MSQSVLLNNLEHKDLRVIAERSAAYGDGVMFSLTFPQEFRQVQAHYPIVFRATSDAAGYEALALFGFEAGENLFLGPQGWDAHYVPLNIERRPFMIGRHGDELHIHIDPEHPRLSRTAGEELFLPYGGTSPYLERMHSVLITLHQGLQAMPAFIQALVEHELLESFALDIELNNGAQHRLSGFHTIHEERLQALPGAALEGLNRAGHLEAIYMVLASLANFRDLIARRERRGQPHVA
ncbi:SapC family protein [Massilia sp. IC2-476]|uniref:SapC family protein n=1 Tax=Massilia sp. IC2-476 TaxID=2887199 RepID=UPI001D11811D|nr:SapC family protein [Massilia sp. IC2-476]MCC2970879.1 SapC family protein [Massilia sp. IC2-476]